MIWFYDLKLVEIRLGMTRTLFCKYIKHVAGFQQKDIDNYWDGDQIKFNMSC